MGFRDLLKFNISLLVKQGWHLLMQPTTLVGRILKAKYYPNTRFFSAPLGSNPSLIWSIWSARELLKMGLR